MRKRYHPTAVDVSRVTANQIAAELGVDWRRAQRLLDKHGWLNTGVKGFGPSRTYDSGVIEPLRALLGQPHRQVEPPHKDWLSQYLEGKDPDAS